MQDSKPIVRSEAIEDMDDIVTIAHRFPAGTSEQEADNWMRLKADVRSEVISRIPIPPSQKVSLSIVRNLA